MTEEFILGIFAGFLLAVALFDWLDHSGRTGVKRAEFVLARSKWRAEMLAVKPEGEKR